MQKLELYKGKKIVITGHTGFKGSWLSIWLQSLGAEVIGVALDPRTEHDNFVLSGISRKIKDYRIDIRNSKEIIQLFQEINPDFLFHLAAQPLVLESYKSPQYTSETNILGTVNLLEAVRLTVSCKSAIFITTDKVYENMEWIWGYRENDRLGGYDPYSASKAAAEIMISSYRNSFFKESGQNISSVRAGNVIGGGDWSKNRLIPDIIRAIENNQVVEIRNPDSTRPWQHVLEPLGGYLLLGAKMIYESGNYCEAWNFGPNPKNIVSVRTMLDLIFQEYGKGSWKDISNNVKQHEASLLSLDIDKARTNLEWEPVLELFETISYTVDWYKNYSKCNVYDLCISQINDYTTKWK